MQETEMIPSKKWKEEEEDRKPDEAKRNYDIWPQRTMFMHDELSKKEISFSPSLHSRFAAEFGCRCCLTSKFSCIEISLDDTVENCTVFSWVHKGKMWNVKVQFLVTHIYDANSIQICDSLIRGPYRKHQMYDVCMCVCVREPKNKR